MVIFISQLLICPHAKEDAGSGNSGAVTFLSTSHFTRAFYLFSFFPPVLIPFWMNQISRESEDTAFIPSCASAC